MSRGKRREIRMKLDEKKKFFFFYKLAIYFKFPSYTVAKEPSSIYFPTTDFMGGSFRWPV